VTGVHHHPELPSPLGVGARAFEAAWRGLGLRPRDGAVPRYSRFYREGDDAGLGGVPAPARVLESESPAGTVRKFCLPVSESEGGALESESVIIPMRHRTGTTHTLCVSSQVGCAMGCDFCETAQMGLMRNLAPAEIVAQWWCATHRLGAAIRNVVFMGMGEPLDNPGAVIDAIDILTGHHGPSVAMRRITVSTVGRIDGLELLRDQMSRPGWKQLGLAVSVNAPNDEIRSRIMPINRAMPLGELIPVLESWPLRSGAAICVEYVLIPGVNDAPEHADELADLVGGVRCCVNVIPYNPRRDSPWPAPTEGALWAFIRRLEARGQFCKLRKTKGRQTMAACGQLGNEHIRKRRFVPLGTPQSA